VQGRYTDSLFGWFVGVVGQQRGEPSSYLTLSPSTSTSGPTLAGGAGAGVGGGAVGAGGVGVGVEGAGYSFQALAATLQGLEPLLIKKPAQACEAGVDASLFLLLDHCFACAEKGGGSAYPGLEVRPVCFDAPPPSGESGEPGTSALGACVSRLVRCIYALVAADVARAPDQRIVYWTLLCRCIALNSRKVDEVVEAEEAGAEGGDAEDEEVFDPDLFAEGAGVGAGVGMGGAGMGVGGGYSPEVQAQLRHMTPAGFAAFCREQAAAHAPSLAHARVQVRCVAVRCMLLALRGLAPVSGILSGVSGLSGVAGSAHTDLALARAATSAALRGLLSGGGVGGSAAGGVGVGGVGVGGGGGGVGASAGEDFGGFETAGFEAGGFDSGGFETGGFEAGGFESAGFEAGGFEAGGFEADFNAFPAPAPPATAPTSIPTSTPSPASSAPASSASLAAALAPVPRYLSLFLTDLVNLACACATFALEERPVLLLQTEAAVLVQRTVELFLTSADPDYKLAGGGGMGEVVEGRLLHQFTSQLLSTVRTNLTSAASPQA
ncbi:hypothetical protein B484DRAFT_407830, partial [Ochromonadaceae sp. CCMP2298]